MNKIIKVKTFQERAVFRVPYSMEIIETYPLPPYSTILGFIHNMMGISNTVEGINISIQGTYGNLSREFTRYQKYDKDNNEGKPYPIIVTSLIDLELLIHIKMPEVKLHNKLLYSLSSPPYFPYFGRPEDLILNMEFYETEEKDFEPSKTEEGGFSLPYNCYIQYEVARNLEIEGIPYLIPSYYKLQSKAKGKKKTFKELFRDFEMIKVVYAQKEQTVLEKIKIDSEGVPLWWMK